MTVEFDRIADVYDETRRALDEETFKGISEMLSEHGCRSILEIGVGTGRVSVPLLRGGFQMTGMDISRRMMEKAEAKGVTDLFLAEGSRVPFRKNAFDATLMAHVFHLLEDPLNVMHAAARVSKVGVFALVMQRGGDWPGFPFSRGGPSADGSDKEAAKKLLEERREWFRKTAEKYKWDWERARRSRNWAREQQIFKTNPPDDLKVVSDVVVTETLEDRIARFQKGAYSYMSDMPEVMREELIRGMRARAKSHPEWARQRRHHVYRLGMWRSETLLRAGQPGE